MFTHNMTSRSGPALSQRWRSVLGNVRQSPTLTTGYRRVRRHQADQRARSRGRLRTGRRGNIVASRSAHPGFAKAAPYLELDLRRAELQDDQRADPADMATMIDQDTVLLVASAPSYPHGVVDDVPAIAGLAASGDLPCHVDACVGGMVLPFARSIGAWQGEFGFNVPGVTSTSVDLHKYGYTAK